MPIADTAGIRAIAAANHYIKHVYRPAYNAEFAAPAAELGSAHMPYIGPALADILCEQFERTRWGAITA